MDEPTQNNINTNIQPSNKKKGKKILVFVAVGIFLILAGGVFGVLYSDTWNPTWDPFVENEQIKESDNSKKEVIDDKKNINTLDKYDYVDKEFGFALNYPKQELEAIDQETDDYLLCWFARDDYFDKWTVFYNNPCTIGVRVIFFPKHAHRLEEYLGKTRNWGNNITLAETIGETRWVKQKRSIRCDTRSQEICGFARMYFTELESENLALEITYNNGGIPDSNIMYSILESVNIFEPTKVKSDSLNIDEWVIHENKKFLYSIQYPKNWLIENDQGATSVFAENGYLFDNPFSKDRFVVHIYGGKKAEDIIGGHRSQVVSEGINDCTEPKFLTIGQNQGWTTDCLIDSSGYPEFKKYYTFQRTDYNAINFNYYTIGIRSASPKLADKVAESFNFIDDPNKQYTSECSGDLKAYAVGGPYRQINYGYWKDEFAGQIDLEGEITTQENNYIYGIGSWTNVIINISSQTNSTAVLESPFVLGMLDNSGKFTTSSEISEEDRQIIEDSIDNKEKIKLHLEIKAYNIEGETDACFIEVK